MKNLVVPAILFINLIFVSVGAWAQSIVKIDGTRVTVEGNFSALKKGQTVNFLDNSLEIKAGGVVDNISPQGKMAIIRITSGSVSKEDTFEFSSQEVKEKPKTSETQLTPEEREILDRGEIGTGAYVVGGVLGTWPLGLGIGHAIQGRYAEKGWIFTVGELGSVALILAGIQNCTYQYGVYGYGSSGCTTNGLVGLGVVGFVGFRIWEIVDLWATPPEINRRYRALKQRTSGSTWSPTIFQSQGDYLLGLQYRF